MQPYKTRSWQSRNCPTSGPNALIIIKVYIVVRSPGFTFPCFRVNENDILPFGERLGHRFTVGGESGSDCDELIVNIHGPPRAEWLIVNQTAIGIGSLDYERGRDE